MTTHQAAAKPATTAFLRKYYMGVGAVVTRLRGSHGRDFNSRECDVKTYLSTAEVSFDAAPVLTIDMNRCYDNIEIDPFNNAEIDGVGCRYDATAGTAPLNPSDKKEIGCHSTTIGLDWPSGGFAGQVYLESNFFSKHISEIVHDRHVWPPRADGKPSWGAQFVQSRRSDGRRYVGFSATLLEDASSETPLKLGVWHPFDEKTYDLAVPWSELDYDPNPFLAGFAIDPMPTQKALKNQRVSAFMSIEYVVHPDRWNRSIMTPKLPFWMGGQ